MAVIGYEPAPNGVGYTFHRDDGPSTYLYGPQADDLARFLEQTRPADARTAAYDPSAPLGSVDAVPPAPAPMRADVGPNMSVVPTAGPAMSVAPPQSPPAPVADAAPPQMPTQPAPGAYEEPPPQESVTRHFKFSGGTAAVDPRKLARDAYPVPVSRTISGAVPETPEEKADRLERQANARIDFAVAGEEQKAVAAERVALAEETRANALNATIAAEQERRDAEKQLQAAKSAADSKWAEIQKENEAVAAQKVDPNRLFHGKNGAAVAIGSAIFQGLGAFGATLARAPNYAHQIIQSAIERDIASQVDAIQRQGAAARNAVADFARTYGLTLDEAKLAVKSAQYKYVASMAELRGAKIGTLDAKQNAANIAMDATKQSEAFALALKDSYEGRAQEHIAMVQPQRGSRGGLVETSREVTTKTGEVDPQLMNSKRQQESYENERRVTLDDGKFAWATTKERADKAQMQVDSSLEYKKNVAEQREILSHAGSSMDPKMRSRYDTLAARNKFLVKGTEDLGAITAADNTMANPITGEGGAEFLRFKDSVLEASKSAEQHINFRLRSAKKQLFREPKAQTLIEPTEASLGIQEGR